MKLISKEKMNNLEIEVNKEGFVLWITEENGNDKHWLLDGSIVKSDGIIDIATRKSDFNKAKHSIVIDKKRSCLKIVQPTS